MSGTGSVEREPLGGDATKDARQGIEQVEAGNAAGIEQVEEAAAADPAGVEAAEQEASEAPDGRGLSR